MRETMDEFQYEDKSRRVGVNRQYKGYMNMAFRRFIDQLGLRTDIDTRQQPTSK